MSSLAVFESCPSTIVAPAPTPPPYQSLSLSSSAMRLLGIALLATTPCVVTVTAPAPFVSYVRECCAESPLLRIGIGAKAQHSPYWVAEPLPNSNLTLGEVLDVASGRAYIPLHVLSNALFDLFHGGGVD